MANCYFYPYVSVFLCYTCGCTMYLFVLCTKYIYYVCVSVLVNCFLALEHMVVFWGRYGGKEIILFLDDTV